MDIDKTLSFIKERCDAATEGLKYHPEIKQALLDRNLDKICEHLHTKNFESDSEWTRQRVQDSYKQAWQDAFEYFDSAHARTDMLLEMVEFMNQAIVRNMSEIPEASNWLKQYKAHVEKIAEKYK